MTPGYRAGLFLLGLPGIAVVSGHLGSFPRSLPALWQTSLRAGHPLQRWRHHCWVQHNVFCCHGPPCPGCGDRLSSPLLCSAGASSSSSGCDSAGKGGHRGQGQTTLLQARLARAACGAIGAVCVVPGLRGAPGAASRPALPGTREQPGALRQAGKAPRAGTQWPGSTGEPRRPGAWPGCVSW